MFVRLISCCCYRKGTNFQANHNLRDLITTINELLLLPQRYKFSSKSQQKTARMEAKGRCCCYRKGTNFQANHNYRMRTECTRRLLLLPQRYKFSSKSQQGPDIKPRKFSCCCYRKGTNFQANHNKDRTSNLASSVVVATAKVQIFKQITTRYADIFRKRKLLLLPQRYKFSSKSQRTRRHGDYASRCCCYRKGTNFQANHNEIESCLKTV